jgi:hypothetical protein
MGNSNRPYGLRPVSSLDGSPLNGRVSKFYVPATDGTAIFIGDLVKTGGTAGQLNAGDPYYPTATVAASGDTVLGVCVGVEPLPGNLSYNYRVASVGMYIFVDTDPRSIYSIQTDSVGAAVADIGLNATITVGGGSTVTGMSTSVISGATLAAGNTLDTLVVGFDPAPDNVAGAYARVLVKLNLHQYGTAIVGA